MPQPEILSPSFRAPIFGMFLPGQLVAFLLERFMWLVMIDNELDRAALNGSAPGVDKPVAF
jgi:hypothetical protein